VFGAPDWLCRGVLGVLGSLLGDVILTREELFGCLGSGKSCSCPTLRPSEPSPSTHG